MTDSSDLDAVYAAYDKWSARAESARARIAKAQKTLEGCYPHLSVAATAERVAEVLASYFPAYTLVVYGPFGLGHEIAIHAQNQAGNTVGAVSFRPDGENRLHLIDWSRNTGRFAPNSLGALNQLNFPESEEPSTLVEIITAMEKQIEEEVA